MWKKEFANLNADKNKKILEIGPSRFPMYPKAEGYCVDIVDYVDESELKKIYVGQYGVENIETVDYICSKNYAENIDREGYYDIVAASHMIEVCVDFISTLNDFSKLLKDNGEIKLIIPDKRYEYDSFREVTALRSIIDAHQTNTCNNSLGGILDYYFNKTTIDGLSVFVPNSAVLYKDHLLHEYDEKDMIECLRGHISDYSDNVYEHIQNWTFTPKSFEMLIYQLNVLDYIDLTIEQMYTVEDGYEFYAVLKKGKEVFSFDRFNDLLVDRRIEEMKSFSSYECIRRLQQYNDKKVYIYGAGERANRVTKQVNMLGLTVFGYIVSDGNNQLGLFQGKEIYELSDITDIDNIIVFIGVSERYRDSVTADLEARGIKYL